MPFKFEKLSPASLVLVMPVRHCDQRGCFAELYKEPDFAAAGITDHFIQMNRSHSTKGVLRGLHYQKAPFAQGKLVRAISGRIYDVAVDIRKGSPTYGKFAAVELDGDSLTMLYIPEGFAHGFACISKSCEVEYLCTNIYSPDHDRGIRFNDPSLMIPWPVLDPVVTDKDRNYPALAEADNDF